MVDLTSIAKLLASGSAALEAPAPTGNTRDSRLVKVQAIAFEGDRVCRIVIMLAPEAIL